MLHLTNLLVQAYAAVNGAMGDPTKIATALSTVGFSNDKVKKILYEAMGEGGKAAWAAFKNVTAASNNPLAAAARAISASPLAAAAGKNLTDSGERLQKHIASKMSKPWAKVYNNAANTFRTQLKNGTNYADAAGKAAAGAIPGSINGVLGNGMIGTGTGWLIRIGPVSDRCQTGVRPVSCRMHSPCHSVSSPMPSPCHSVSSPMPSPRHRVMSDAQSCRMHRSVMSDAQCHCGCTVSFRMHSVIPGAVNGVLGNGKRQFGQNAHHLLNIT